ncbi:MAG: hypothetical protein L3J59_00705 [Methylococcaceae bacterium]|nr:hypothetical protein [Methylococcaceae bacterium]
MKKTFVLLIMSLFLIAGCSSAEQDSTTQDQPKKVQLFKEQTEALEKAKGVEKMLQMGADRNQKIIEEQTR